MEAGKIIEILSDYNYWGNSNAKLNEREAIAVLKSNLEVPVVNVVKGVRRSGKSSLVLKLVQELGLEKSTLIINLEDPRLPFNVDAAFLMEALEAYSVYVDPEGPKLVVIDEAQHAYGWERFARYVVETKRIKCIVTGSSSQLLSEEYATSLTGRHIDLVVFPLSFSEFLKFKGVQASTKLEVEKNRLAIQRLFNEYIEFGGFPEVVLTASKETKKNILTNYFEDILIKDIVKRYKVKLVPQIESVAKDCLANIAGIASMRRIANSYEISLHTVERFFGFFANAYLFFFIKKFSFSKRKQERSLVKAYAIDNGFYSALGFKSMEQKDRLMENAVAVELTRRYGTENIFYWQDYQNHEIDFVVKEGKSVKQLIQVTYASSYKEVKKRETDNLVNAAKALRCSDLVVITWGYEAHEKYKGKNLVFVPIWKWLLNVNKS
ncbi:MAG: ATP-binding protein [Candidatus Micrarchaeia archaeon]